VAQVDNTLVYTLDSGNSCLEGWPSEAGNSDLVIDAPFPSNSLFSATVMTPPADLGGALLWLLESRPRKNAPKPRRRTPKGTPTPIAALSPVVRLGEEGDEAVVGFEVVLAVEGLLD
jgi:hypothetical protein